MPILTVPRTPALHGRDRVPGGLDRGQRVPRLGQQRPSGIGQPDPVRGPLQEPGAEFALQRPNRDRQRGLNHPQPLRRPGEAALLGDRDEVLQLPQFHGYASCR